MTIVKRLRLLTAVLGCVAASAVVGTTVFGDVRGRPEATPVRSDPSVPSYDEAARTKFTSQPALTYKNQAGETIFAWQVKPAVAAQPQRPRDIMVMVDTSASQAGQPLSQARAILSAFAREAKAEDRLDIWTVNINDPSATRSLTGGFQPATAEAIQKAIVQLEDTVYGSGAVDLKAGLEQAARQFERRAGRNQVLLYLGDGESAASPSPLEEAGRVDLGHCWPTGRSSSSRSRSVCRFTRTTCTGSPP